VCNTQKIMTIPNYSNYLPVTTMQHPTTTLLPEHQLSQSHWSYRVWVFHLTNIVYHFPPTSQCTWVVDRVCYVNKTSRQEATYDIYQTKLRCYITQKEVTRIPEDQPPLLHNCGNIKICKLTDSYWVNVKLGNPLWQTDNTNVSIWCIHNYINNWS
jgi:hypothetical protein